MSYGGVSFVLPPPFLGLLHFFFEFSFAHILFLDFSSSSTLLRFYFCLLVSHRNKAELSLVY